MNNPDIFIDAINPFLSVILITDIFILGFILAVSIYDQDKWAVMHEDAKISILAFIRCLIFLVVWDIFIIELVLFKENNIDNAYVFIDFIDPFLSIILIMNILKSLSMFGVLFFEKQIWKDIPNVFQNIVKIILSVIAIYFLTLVGWEIAIAAEIIFT